jgi:hypothetical protein
MCLTYKCCQLLFEAGGTSESILVYAYWAALGSAPASILMDYTKNRGFFSGGFENWRVFELGSG